MMDDLSSTGVVTYLMESLLLNLESKSFRECKDYDVQISGKDFSKYCRQKGLLSKTVEVEKHKVCLFSEELVSGVRGIWFVTLLLVGQASCSAFFEGL